MKSLLKIFTFMLLIHSAFSQNVQTPTVTWGPKARVSKKEILNQIIGTDKSGTYFLKTKYGFAGKVLIEKVGVNLEQLQRQELDLSYNKHQMTLEKVEFRNDEILLFTTFNNKRDKKHYLFLRHINKESLQPTGEPLKVAEINYTGHKKWNIGSYHFKMSRDDSKLLVYYNLPYDSEAYEKFGLHVFDEKNKQIWTKKIQLPEKENEFAIGDFTVDNWGDVHLIGRKISRSKKTIKKGFIIQRLKEVTEYSYQPEILSLKSQGRNFKRFKIDIGDKNIADMEITVNNHREILCSGYYTAPNEFGIAGAFYLRIDILTRKIKKQSFIKFGQDILTQDLSPKERKKLEKNPNSKAPQLSRYKVKELVLRGDGGVILIGQQEYEYITTSTHTDQNGNTYTTTTYHYISNDILVVNISPDGEIDWAKKIPKRQHTTNDRGFYSSYYLVVTPTKLNFIFNDHIKNIEAPVEGIVRQFSGGKYGAVAIASLDSKGKYKKELLFRSKDIKTIIRPKVCFQQSNTKTMLYGRKRKSYQFAILEFK